jgi:hypothetical protein
VDQFFDAILQCQSAIRFVRSYDQHTSFFPLRSVLAIMPCIDKTPFPERREFHVSDSGVVRSTLYRTDVPSSVFGMMIGRKAVKVKGNKFFHEEDVVRAGWLDKQGFRVKSWKKRYFVLRRDICQLCWYDTDERNGMTLLGSCDLDELTTVRHDHLQMHISLPKSSTKFLTLRDDVSTTLAEWVRDMEYVCQSGRALSKRWWEHIFGETSHVQTFGLQRDVENEVPYPLKVPVPETTLSTDSHDAELSSRASKVQSTSRGVGNPVPPYSNTRLDAHNYVTETGNVLRSVQLGICLKNVAGVDQDVCVVIMKGRRPVASNRFSISASSNSVEWTEVARTEFRSFEVPAMTSDDSGKCFEQFGTLMTLQNLLICPNAPPPSFEEMQEAESIHSRGAMQNLLMFMVCLRSDSNPVLTPLSRIILEPSSLKLVQGESTMFNMEVLYSPLAAACEDFGIDGLAGDAGYAPEAWIAFSEVNSVALADHRATFDLGLGGQSIAVAKDATVLARDGSHQLQDGSPYAESLFAMESARGRIYSMEQIFASRYAVSAGAAFLDYLIHERMSLFMRGHISSTEFIAGDDDHVVPDAEDLTHMERDMMDMWQSHHDRLMGSYEPKFLEPRTGGHCLRPSVLKKECMMQATTMNLNVHMLVSELQPFMSVIEAEDGSSGESKLSCTATITLGCPCAHQMGFRDGGLRRFMGKIKYQSERLDAFATLQSTICLPPGMRDSPIPAAKLCIRLDHVCAQTLGLAVTSIKTVVSLALQYRGKYFESLVSQLNCGFLVSVSSYLTCSGKEMGMLEDLDAGMLWLSLVTFRFVRLSDTNSTKNDGIRVTRHANGRTILVDIPVVDKEAELVIQAASRAVRAGYKTPEGPQFVDVLASARAVGVVFTQGVNEMDALATTTRSSDLHVQTHINYESLLRLEQYFTVYSVYIARTLSPSSIIAGSDQVLMGPLTDKLVLLKGMVTEAMEDVFTRNTNILFEASSLCRELSGVNSVLCKSGKDRTAQGVTFEQARDLAVHSALTDVRKTLDLFRNDGVRRYNVWANTGQPLYAINEVQRSFFPQCLKPPSGTYTSGVAS